MIGKVLDTFVIEFDQASCEEYHSSHSRIPSLSRTLRRIKLRAPIQARAPSVGNVPPEANVGGVAGKGVGHRSPS